MRSNRSMPQVTVIPVLSYPDVREAATWLCQAFGFRERLRIGDHRIQLHVGNDGAIVVRQSDVPAGADSVMVRVENALAHYEQARRLGAKIVHAPTDQPYGERQYSVVDAWGHSWTFSESVADSDPASWGGEAVELK